MSGVVFKLSGGAKRAALPRQRNSRLVARSSFGNEYGNFYYDRYMSDYKTQLESCWKLKLIHPEMLKEAIKSTWPNANYVSLNTQNAEVFLDISSKPLDESFEYYVIQTTNDMNLWNISHYVLEMLRTLTDGCDVNPDIAVSIPIGIPLNRLSEFYGTKRNSI